MRSGVMAAPICVTLVSTAIRCSDRKSDVIPSGKEESPPSLTMEDCEVVIDHLIDLMAQALAVDLSTEDKGIDPELFDQARTRIEQRRDMMLEGCQSDGTPEKAECIKNCQDVDCIRDSCSIHI